MFCHVTPTLNYTVTLFSVSSEIRGSTIYIYFLIKMQPLYHISVFFLFNPELTFYIVLFFIKHFKNIVMLKYAKIDHLLVFQDNCFFYLGISLICKFELANLNTLMLEFTSIKHSPLPVLASCKYVQMLFAIPFPDKEPAKMCFLSPQCVSVY